MQQEDLRGALGSYGKALSIRETLAGRDPGNTEWKRDLSMSYNKVGDVQMQQEDLSGALGSYRKALSIRETLAGHDPANADWQRDLIVSLVKVGKASKDRGYLQRALEIALSLKNSGKLAPGDDRMVDGIRSLLAK